MKIFNIHQAKTHFSSLVEQVAAGETVIIGKAGKPVIKLIKYSPNSDLMAPKPGMYAGQIKIPDDFTAESAEVESLMFGDDDA